MPGIDLTTLSGVELKRLLKAAHARGDGTLADRVEWEIAARGAGGPAHPAAPPIGAHPDHHDAPWDDEAPAADETPADEAEPDHLAEPFVLAREPRPRPRPRSAAPLVGVGLVAGCLLTAGAFWGVQTWRSATPGPPPAPRAMAAVTAPAAPPASTIPAVPVVEAPAPAPAPAAEPAPAPAARREAARPVRVAKAEPAAARGPKRLDPCSQPPTAADRLVCEDLGLQELDFEFRNAYARARAARADPVILGDAQTAWRRARDETSDPHRLARLYDARIRELNEAAAAAAREEPPLD